MVYFLGIFVCQDRNEKERFFIFFLDHACECDILDPQYFITGSFVTRDEPKLMFFAFVLEHEQAITETNK